MLQVEIEPTGFFFNPKKIFLLVGKVKKKAVDHFLSGYWDLTGRFWLQITLNLASFFLVRITLPLPLSTGGACF